MTPSSNRMQPTPKMARRRLCVLAAMRQDLGLPAQNTGAVALANRAFQSPQTLRYGTTFQIQMTVKSRNRRCECRRLAQTLRENESASYDQRVCGRDSKPGQASSNKLPSSNLLDVSILAPSVV